MRPIRFAAILWIAAGAISLWVAVANKGSVGNDATIRLAQVYDAKLRGELGGLPIGRLDGSRPYVILLGDSHALAIAAALDEKLKALSQSGHVQASGGVRLANWNPSKWDLEPDERKIYDESRHALLVRSQPALIVLSARWEAYMGYGGMTAVRDLLDGLRLACPGSTIVIIGQHPRLHYPDINHAEWIAWRSFWGVKETSLKQAPDSQAGQANRILRDYCAGKENILFVNTEDLFATSGGRAITFIENRALYHDDDHLSIFGAQHVLESALASPKLKPFFNSTK